MVIKKGPEDVFLKSIPITPEGTGIDKDNGFVPFFVRIAKNHIELLNESGNFELNTVKDLVKRADVHQSAALISNAKSRLYLEASPELEYQEVFDFLDRFKSYFDSISFVDYEAKKKESPGQKEAQAAFEKAAAGSWKESFADPGTGDWKTKWFLDGKVGTVTNSPEGMTLTAGLEFKKDAHHMVLWTKEEFKGDLKIEYDYTRLDDETRCVTILYLQATGSGVGPYHKDISKWNELREVPSMRTYFNHMHTYHISYAAFPNSSDDTAYLRARRYLPEKFGLKGTELMPDYFPEGLFEKGVKHHLTVIKKDRDLFMKIENPTLAFYCHFQNRIFPVITEGRIGLRHMYTRSARYQNFTVSVPKD